MHQSEEQKERLMGRFNRSLMGMCVCVLSQCVRIREIVLQRKSRVCNR